MSERKVKMWTAASLGCAAMMSGVASSGTTETSNFPGGTLDSALEHIFAGEGGEGGLGFTSMQRAFSVPALDDAQLRKVLVNNTLSQKRLWAMHFKSDGTISGWQRAYREVAASRCPKTEVPGDGLRLEGNRCLELVFEPFKNKSWQIKSGQVCLPDVEEKPVDSCYYAALVLNSVVLFGEDGKMAGKGNDLLQGDKTDAVR